MTIKPTANRVLLEQEDKVEVTKGGVYLPDKAKRDNVFAKVLAVGPQVTEVKVGDRVIYKPSLIELKEIDGVKEQIIVVENHIIAVITD